MTTLSSTEHATTRMHQRSFPPIVIDWLDEFGEEQFDGRGGVVHPPSITGVPDNEPRFGNQTSHHR
jgi:hypothetical protein